MIVKRVVNVVLVIGIVWWITHRAMDPTAAGFFWLTMIVLLFVSAIAGLFTESGRNRSPAVWIVRFLRQR